MRLADIAASGQSIAFTDIGGFKDLALELQGLLASFGVLDPPSDGIFGQVSRWAFGETLKKLGFEGKSSIDKDVAQALLAANADTLFALTPQRDLAGKIVDLMIKKNYWLNRHPDCINIVYIEGAETDGTPNGNPPNQFNDVRFLVRFAQPSGVPTIVGAWEATTEPGKFYTQNPEDPNGAARIALSQFKSWVVGLHGKGAGQHEALVQAASITVYRDRNRDYSRVGDLPYAGIFGINQHWGYDLPRTDIQNASAGCLVGRLKSGHQAFMKLVKTDARYRQNNGYLFMTAILAATDL